MATYLSPISNDQVVDSNGSPLVGGWWRVYLAGTTTPVTTYTDSTGITPQPTDITLDASGRPANPIWLSGGIPVKFRLYSASGVILLTVDNVSGINDPAGITAQDQWVLYGAAPTYLSATSFSLVGDQTNTFQIGRRIKSVNTGGIRYSSITNSVYGAVTTVTVTNDSGTLDSGMSAVSYGLLSSLNSSVPTTIARSGANVDITSLQSSTTVTTQTAADQSTKIASTLYADRVSAKIQPVTATIGSNAITVNLGPTTIDFRSTTLATGTPTSVTSSATVSLVIASTDSFGLVTAAGSQRLAILAINNAGTIELAAVALYGGVSIDETGVITTATTATTSTGIKAAAVRTGVAYRVVGYLDATFTTAVGWGSLALVQGYGGNAADATGSIGFGQTWQSTGKATSTTYYNNTGKPIMVSVIASVNAAGNIKLTIGSVDMAQVANNGTGGNTLTVAGIVPPGASYSTTIAGGGSITLWLELRL